ncbi:unnamed protein product [Lactuca saligna]|uniref:Uncharacterized protein n=1 Tax=Lactuca saligna TaxID=75948 RepID=A0AA36EKG3_LACSI|nr:unnamed protein product [Lactuca saligna]
MFLMVEREILHSLVSCSQKSVTLGVVSDICIVKHKRTNLSKKKVVVEKKEKVDIDCEWNFNTSEGDFELEEFMQKLEVFMTYIGEQGSDESPVTKEAHIDKLYEATTNPQVVDVENPPMVKNKGSAT